MLDSDGVTLLPARTRSQEYRCGMERCSRPRSNNMFGLEKHLREQHHRSFCKVTHARVYPLNAQPYEKGSKVYLFLAILCE